ncbi:hypothetical protein [Pseudonocardia spirodelae]|uniref:Uncharacterized protein n=1 Tax=Pseudonocardia spirodelae TaxID=3133431 RepID=A0ABU8TA14_9PSEU
MSLSPGTVRAAAEPHRLVLPSPDGSTIAAAAPGTVLGMSLRNRSAAAGVLLGPATDPLALLRSCPSGRELVDGGWGDDVAVAAELDGSTALPLLTGGVFVPAADRPAGGRPVEAPATRRGRRTVDRAYASMNH